MELFPSAKGVEDLALAVGQALYKPPIRYSSEKWALQADIEAVRAFLEVLLSVKRTDPEKRQAIKELSKCDHELAQKVM